jgi:hypothetical protein
MIERELLTFPLDGKDVEAEMKTFNVRLQAHAAPGALSCKPLFGGTRT